MNLWQRVKLKLFKLLNKNTYFGGIVPITRSKQFRTGIKPEEIKNMLAKEMLPEIMNYIQYSSEITGEGVTIIKARLDVVRKDEVL